MIPLQIPQYGKKSENIFLHISGRSEKPVISHEQVNSPASDFSLSGRKQSPDSFDRAPAGGFLVRRPRSGSEGLGLDGMPASGMNAGVTDEEPGHPCQA